MADLSITLGNRNYSSWSLRAWLALKRTDADFEETVIPLDRPETQAAIAERSPSGRVPALDHGGLFVWDSLAIVEYLAELFPEAGLWPNARPARALARSVTAEMHSSFQALRRHMPMDIRSRHPRPEDAATNRDIGRVVEIWRDCRARFGAGGPFLFGRFTAADAFYAPVASRFVTYGVELPDAAAEYRDAVMQTPEMQAWSAAAEAEPWVIENP